MSQGTAVIAAGAAGIAQAIKASGVLVRVKPKDFQILLQRDPHALVVLSEGGVFSKRVF